MPGATRASPRRRCVMFVAAAVAFVTLLGCDEQALQRAGPAPTPPSPSAAPAPPKDAATVEISFVRDGRPVRTASRAELEAAIPTEQWTAYDPYYKRPKTFRALPLAAVLEKGFGEPAAALSRYDYVLRAQDGYAVPLAGDKVFEKGGYVAVADVEVPGWEPIGESRANPGPFYVVWREPEQWSLDTHPRPWQLATIEIAPFEATYPHTVPAGVQRGAPAMRGFRIFRESCIACHAINREGGRVGPDLNVPRSIVEYRPEPQIRAYIADPRSFRYSNMPAHPGFGAADLDALVAYFRAMKDQKSDPEAQQPGAR